MPGRGRPVRSRLRRPAGSAFAALAVLAASLLAPPGAEAAEEVAGPDALARLVDDVVTAQLDEHGIPGAVAVVVAGGEVVLARGYGRTALEGGVPVDPERTRFDIGSVTKLVTATAVMQQAERGRIDLDADVNRYLSALQVPATFPAPVTTAHLLTHTAGFADRHFVRMVSRSPEEIEPLGEHLAANLPRRIRPPGEAHQYSNHGIALAGHVVEAVSGQAFGEYLRDNVLEPLGMSRTTFGEAPDVAADDAAGHESLVGPTAAVEPWYLMLTPAGGLWSTGADMARFMLAHLNGGRLDGRRILRPETVAAMQRTQFSPHPEVSGIGYGFFERRAGERRVVQHGGGWIGFGSFLALLPDKGVGVFASFNHGRGVTAAVAVADAVLDRYFRAPAVGEATGVAEQARTYEGTYRWNRVDRDTFMRLVSTLQTATLEVRATGDGTLTTTMSPYPLVTETRWVESEEGVFRSENGASTLAFELDENGSVVGLSVAGAQLFTMDRLAWYETTASYVATLLVLVGVLLAAAVGWPAGSLYRRVRRRRGETSRGLRRARLLGGLAGALGVVFFAGLAGYFAADAVGVLQVSTGLRALLLLPVLVAVLTAPLLVVVARLWLSREGSAAERLYHSGIVIALTALVPFLYHWRLLGFHY